MTKLLPENVTKFLREKRYLATLVVFLLVFLLSLFVLIKWNFLRLLLVECMPRVRHPNFSVEIPDSYLGKKRGVHFYRAYISRRLKGVVINIKFDNTWYRSGESDDNLARFLKGTLVYSCRFTDDYPYECEMAEDLTYSNSEYMKVFLDIWHNLHTRNWHRLSHRWLRKMNVDLYGNLLYLRENERLEFMNLEDYEKSAFHQKGEENTFGLSEILQLLTVTAVTIVPALFESLYF